MTEAEQSKVAPEVEVQTSPTPENGANPSVNDAYITQDARVLDPSLIDKSLMERMPNPVGYRLLVLPYKGKGIRYADEHVRRKTGKAFASGTA